MGVIPKLEARVEKLEIRNESLTDEVMYVRKSLRETQNRLEQLEVVLFSMLFDGQPSAEVIAYLKDPDRHPIVGLSVCEKLDRLKLLLTGETKTQAELERDYERSIFPDRPMS